jgi:hypothetical protein
MASGRTQEQLNKVIRQQYQGWATGDGVTTEFPLPKKVGRLDDLCVIVAGLDKRPSDKGTAYDFKVRGITAGYDGDTNMVKFTAAPAAGADIKFIVNAS